MKPKIRQNAGFLGFCLQKNKLRMARPGAPALRGRGRPGGSGPRVVAGCEETKRKTKPHMLICRLFGLVRWCTITRVQPLLLSGARAVHQLQVSLPDAECERSVTVASIHTYVSSRCRGALTGRLVASLSRTFACRRRASSCRSPS